MKVVTDCFPSMSLVGISVHKLGFNIYIYIYNLYYLSLFKYEWTQIIKICKGGTKKKWKTTLKLEHETYVQSYMSWVDFCNIWTKYWIIIVLYFILFSICKWYIYLLIFLLSNITKKLSKL